MATPGTDVVVVGGGNAAMCAAVAAARAGASVLVVEAAAKFYRGGNTRHTRNIRCAHDAATATLKLPGGDWLFGGVTSADGETFALKLADGTVIKHSRAILAWVEQQPAA